MQHLRDTDGTSTHRRAIRFHLAKCRSGHTPLHDQLRLEAGAAYQDLKAKQRAAEDVEDDLAEAAAEADTTEIVLENALRDVDADLERLDRDRPGTNARRAVFPAGFGAVIEPEGERQLDVLPALHVRLEPYKGEPSLASSMAKLTAAEGAFKQALVAEDAANAALEVAFAKELAARAAVRAQLTSAHARLRDLYKSRPAQAEAFFIKLGRKEGKPRPTGKVAAGEPKGGGISTGGAPPAE